ncbi:endosomal peripheral membrane protein-like protein [Microthyrium microscopicum]|uniref:Endosomal peripheral membrane protein-like protein n=1 Tax=Microthyrium microscopicum TaxID=703497 RepID=A0A6A6U9A1_9PEZI|nr:endosomal peripheral membrane protein-like protein [Microthyrium microscopicum]
MTSQILASELTTLIQDSKRKNQDLRNAAETSLQELKVLPNTSEQQIAADLSRRSQFIAPFLIACSSKNSKYAATGMACLQRLTAAHALPKARLKDVLDAITECTNLGLDIQLKILQTLPSLLQNYADQINGASFFTVIQICSTLQSSKTPAVSGTAAATLQQLFASLYEKLASEDRRALEIPTSSEVQVEDGKLAVRTVAFDAYRIFHDLCALVGGDKPHYVRFSATSEPALLELIESIFTSYPEAINTHPEQAHLVKSLLIPYLIKSFSEKSVFPVTVRVMRLLYLIIKNHLALFPEDTETILQWLNHGLDQDGTAPWKRILCMEVFREIYTDASLVLDIYQKFHGGKDQKPIISDCLASFVRLATEKPALIGLGQQSSVPIGHYFQRESGDNQDTLMSTGGSAGVPTSAVPGISTQFNAVRTPCIEQLDKTEPPSSPETYIYGLVLVSLNNLAESLAKFILPLTMVGNEKLRRRGKASKDDEAEKLSEVDAANLDPETPKARHLRKKSNSVNPMDLTDHPAFQHIKAAADLIDKTWHAILATYSTFFHAALDAENYRALVRSFQKYTQVAGILQMTVPRDAFLTTLGKNAMPPNILTAGIASAGSQPPQTPSLLRNATGFLGVDNIVNQASSFLPERRRQSIDSGEVVLNVRNLLCLRALLNLAIALGPTLETSWRIVFETLQQADRVLATSGGKLYRSVSGAQTPNLSEPNTAQQIGSEVAAVQAAASRLLESTAELSNPAFVFVLKALYGLVRQESATQSSAYPGSPPETPRHTRRIASFSGLSVKTGVQDHDFLFTLTKLRELATLNLERFISSDDDAQNGWNILLDELVVMAADQSVPTTARLLAIDLIRKLSLDSIATPMNEDGVDATKVYARALAPLRSVAIHFKQNSAKSDGSVSDETTIEAHTIVLDALRSFLEHAGESLVDGWGAVFDIIQSSFFPASTKPEETSIHRAKLISVSLGRSAFGSLQLICSDFLSSSLEKDAAALVDLLYNFNSQEQDLNIALTTTTLFWNVSDFLYGKLPLDSLDKIAKDPTFKIANATALSETPSGISTDAVVWLYLLKKLSDLVGDNRHEVRNTTVHTTIRIFDNHGDDLSPAVWKLCFYSVLFSMVSIDVEAYTTFQAADGWDQSEETVEALVAKISTSKVILESLSTLMASYLDKLLEIPDFPKIWDHFMDSLTDYLSHGLHELTASIFLTLETILSKASTSSFPESCTARVFSIWENCVPPKSAPVALPQASNVPAFEAYAASLVTIYNLRRDKISSKDTTNIVKNLEFCLRESESPSYSSDLDSPTALQKKIIDAVRMLRLDLNGSTNDVVALLARFIGLPFEIDAGEKQTGITFIALSKASMAVLEKLLKEPIAWSEILKSDTMYLLLHNLEKVIALKYHWSRQGRSPQFWRKATSASISILDSALPQMFAHQLEPTTLRKLWEPIVNIAHNIAHAEHLDTATVSSTTISDDEAFDITSLRKITALITPAINSPVLHDTLRRTYTRSLFTASLIHDSDPYDLPDLSSEPLKDLYTIRYGRTFDAPPCPRQAMAYFCFHTLISLLAAQDSPTSQVKLAKAAAPYAILRAALPLRAYIADQPLRGQLPMSASLQRELVTMLRELGKLKCEEAAIPPVGTSPVAGSGSHLVRLFPLVVKAAGVRSGPAEVKSELVRWMDTLGREMGLDGL